LSEPQVPPLRYAPVGMTRVGLSFGLDRVLDESSKSRFTSSVQFTSL
jgi:hypothetical protein